MKKLILCLLICANSFVVLQAQTDIKSAEISFVFISKDVDGTIDGFESESSIDLNNIEGSSFKGSVAVETLKTGNFLRDWSLKKSKYFNEEDFPRILFESTTIAKTNNGFLVDGLVTIKGKSKPLSISFKRNGNQLRGNASLYSSDFGVNIKSEREDNLVQIIFLFELKNDI